MKGGASVALSPAAGSGPGHPWRPAPDTPPRRSCGVRTRGVDDGGGGMGGAPAASATGTMSDAG